MTLQNKIVEKEKKALEDFFKKSFSSIPQLPEWITKEHLLHWQENLFSVHYLPNISLEENESILKKEGRAGKVFYKKIKEGVLPENAKQIKGRWVLVDKRKKPKERVVWITATEAFPLEKLGLNPKNYLKTWKRQLHEKDYLKEELKKRGFGSRFCLNRNEAEELKPFTLKFLNIPPLQKIRFPYLAEYAYLGSVFYKQWKEESTWEWVEDKLSTGEYLAVGSRSVSLFGWEPPEFWSTVLSFRFLIEL